MGSSYARNLFYSAVALVGTVLGAAGIAYTSPGFLGYLVLALVVVLTVLASLAFSGVLPFEGILKFVPGFRPSDPQSIRESHHENILKRIMEDFGASLPSEQIKANSKYSVKCQDRLCVRAKRCKVRADMHWGRPSSRRRFKAAWLYVSAADIYCLAGKPAEAGNLYHWALTPSGNSSPTNAQSSITWLRAIWPMPYGGCAAYNGPWGWPGRRGTSSGRPSCRRKSPGSPRRPYRHKAVRWLSRTGM